MSFSATGFDLSSLSSRSLTRFRSSSEAMFAAATTEPSRISSSSLSSSSSSSSLSLFDGSFSRLFVVGVVVSAVGVSHEFCRPFSPSIHKFNVYFSRNYQSFYSKRFLIQEIVCRETISTNL